MHVWVNGPLADEMLQEGGEELQAVALLDLINKLRGTWRGSMREGVQGIQRFKRAGVIHQPFAPLSLSSHLVDGQQRADRKDEVVDEVICSLRIQ